MNGPQIEQNDDEAERAQRRRTFGKSSTSATLSGDSLIEEQQGLQNCLKIFHDNKICQKNAWTLTIIDNLANLLGSHHKTLKNFQIVGSSLEATSKIYGLRVDSVHSDVVRMSSGLGRMKNDLPSVNEDDDQDNKLTMEDGSTKTPVKKKRARKPVSTITTNKCTINSRLDLIQMPDSLYFQLNSIMGETSSSNKLLLNLLQTKCSDLSLTMDDKFWDNKSYEQITFNADDNYETNETQYTELPIKLKIDTKLTLRQQMKGYTILNTPLDDDEDDEQPQASNATFNMSQCLEYAFDMDAEVEPIPVTDNYSMDVMDFDSGHDFDDLTQDDRAAISACKGLRRKTTLIEDLRPSDSTKLEYSYRPLDNINQYWAGPSYWKFRKSRKLTIEQGSMGTIEFSSVAPTAHAKRKINKNRIEPIKFTKLIENVCDSPVDSDDDTFITVDSKHAQKFKKTNNSKRWDSKKLKLPTDLHIDRNLFNYYAYCPNVYVGIKQPSETPANEVDTDDGFDFDSTDDRPFCTKAEPDDDESIRSVNDVIMTDVPDVEIPSVAQTPDSQNSQNEHEISQTYEGAPEMIQKVEIQFARRAKVIDMKQMKSVCLNTITKQCEKTSNLKFIHPNVRNDEKYKEGAASFGIIYNSLPHLLSKTMAENLSPSIAFYSILHLANEHRLRLYKSTKDNDMNIFLIRQLDE